jgi:tRNA-2-methylthio-N6-dimethylallyladenosine synthase
MRGCGNYCAYCVVPYLRGPERSRAHEDIIAEIGSLADDGVREVTLLGQNVNSYSDGTIDFPRLLREACKVQGIARIRFTTSHPKDVSRELLEVMAEEQKVCNWLHLPVQSGSNRVLQSMNRKYTREEYFDLVESARDSVDGLAITTDVMVGFPGETEDDFGLTLDLVERVGFDFAYMFMYSRREGTKAAELEDLPVEIRKQRLEKIIEIQNRIAREKNEDLVGTTVEILVEGNCKRGNYDGYGRTGTNKVVLFKGISRAGDCVGVEVRGLSGWTPWGEVAGG